MNVVIVTHTVGQCFGTTGLLINADDGTVVAETGTKPYGFTGVAITAAEALAAKLGHTIVEDEALQHWGAE